MPERIPENVALRRERDPAPETIGNPYCHEDERECFYRADGSGWWPWRFEDGAENRSGGTVCFRAHTDPSRVIPPEVTA